MANLVLILVTLALLCGFIALTWYEDRRSTRVFAAQRARLDARVSRLEFIIEHVDLSAFLRDEVRRIAARVGHDIAHLSLQAVRFTERLLTRLVRHLRVHEEIDLTPRESARPFVKTLSEFKDRLKAAQPEAQEIQ